jgi:putative tryptophan/tyrosine transport system substrate-binding protein
MCATPSALEAQPQVKVARIGFLGAVAGNPQLDALRQGLRDLGWIEGQNLVVEVPAAGDAAARAADLVHRNVDVIVTSALSVQAVKSATATIPIVFVIPEDPVASGLVASLARPGGNITGLSSLNVELDAKRLALLKEAMPGLTRVAALVNPADPRAGAMLAATEGAARSVGVRIQVVEVRAAADLDAAVRAAAKGKAEALTVLGSSFYFSRVPELAAQARLPVIAPWRQFPEAGGLMSYGPDIPEMFRRAAAYVDRILKGAKAADLPVEQPTKFELVLNLKTAKALGLTIPASVLAQADVVIR